MEPLLFESWISDERCGAGREQVREVRSAGTTLRIGQAGRDELTRAQRATERAWRSWSCEPRPRREGLVSALYERMTEPTSRMRLEASLAEHLDLAPAVIRSALMDEHRRLWRGRGEPEECEEFEEFEEPEEFGRLGARRPGALVLRTHCAALWRDSVGLVCRALAEGRPVLWLADMRLPFSAALMVAALEECTVLGSVVQVLFDGGSELFSESVAWAERSADQPLAPECLAVGPAYGIEPWIRGLDCDSMKLVGEPWSVSKESDLRRTARAVVRHAFGVTPHWFGQLAGTRSKVFVDRHVFSDFTAQLLACVQEQLAEPPRVPVLDEGARKAIRAARTRALDEGATLLIDPEEPPWPSQGRRSRSMIGPSVFTNVDPRMAFQKALGGLPVLVLQRR